MVINPQGFHPEKPWRGLVDRQRHPVEGTAPAAMLCALTIYIYRQNRIELE